MKNLSNPHYSPLIGHSGTSTAQWRPGMRYFPWLAGLSIVLLIFCTISSVAIIALSDNQPVKSWRFEPAVLLAVVSAIGNAAMAFTLSQGAAIAWWRAALHGATLRDLHFLWSFGKSSFRPTSKMSGSVLKMAIVALIVLLVTIANNPLLQRATRITNGLTISYPSMSVDVMKDPVYQAYGLAQPGVPANTLLVSSLIAQVNDWYNGTPLQTLNRTGYTCDGTCEGTVDVPGLDANCTKSTTFLDITDPSNDGQPIFSINFTRLLTSQGTPVLSLDVVRSVSVNENCIASMSVEHCDIATALVQRKFLIQNDSLTLVNGSKNILARLHSDFDSPDTFTGAYVGPLSALHWLGVYYFESSITLDFALPVKNTTAFLAHGIVPASVSFEVYKSNATSCDITFISPLDSIIHSMEEVLFRMAIGSDDPKDFLMETQIFQAVQTTPTLVFHSNYTFLGIAVGIIAIALFAVLVPLWGWWQLGRSVDLSPLETANAFGAPLMKKTTLANDARDLISEIGHIRVRYGAVTGLKDDTGMNTSRLEIAEHDQVTVLVDGQQFGDADNRRTTVTITEHPLSYHGRWSG